MSYSYTVSESSTFTITHARYIASKVSADLKRMQRFYDQPSTWLIDKYEEEIAQLLKHGYLKAVTYGFERNGNWIEPTLIYNASDLDSGVNDDPGKVRPGKDVTNASFYSFLEYSESWYSLSESERDSFKDGLPIQRSTASTPGIDGYVESDRNYSSGGKLLARSSVRSF